MFRAAAILVLGFATYWSARLAWTDHLSRRRDLAACERAVRLSLSASASERLAQLRDDLGGDSLPDLARAAQLDPANALRFETLGQRAEMRREFALAEASLLRAAELSRLYQPRYLLAQYYFRRRNREGWKRWSREAFVVAPADVKPLLDLAWRMNPDPAALTRQALPLRAEVARQFLLFLAKNRSTVPASPLARQLAEAGTAADLPALLVYCDQSLANAETAGALLIWNTLCRRRLLPYTGLDYSSVTNGDFMHSTVGGAFDWHFEKELTWQYVPLRRGATYRLRYEGGPGAIWRVFYPSPSGWREVLLAAGLPDALTFQAPADVIRLALMGKGKPTVSGVRLEMQQ